MEPERLYRQSVTAMAISIFRRPDLKEEMHYCLEDPDLLSQRTINHIAASAFEKLSIVCDRWRQQIISSAKEKLTPTENIFVYTDNLHTITQSESHGAPIQAGVHHPENLDIMSDNSEHNNRDILPKKIGDVLSTELYLFSWHIVMQAIIYHDLGCFHENILDDIMWDSNGKIDELGTCKQILERDLDLDVKIRLACIYCLEDEVHNLLLTKDGYWKRQVDDILLEDSYNHNYNTLIRYWFEQLRKKISHKDITVKVSDKEAACKSILLCNEVALKHFFEKLTSEDKSYIINSFMVEMFQENTFPYAAVVQKYQISHTIYFLVQQCDEENLKDLCLRCRSPDLATKILLCFLTFPYRNYFFSYAAVLLKLIEDEKCFCELLTETLSNLQNDPELYEIIYNVIWKEYCSKYEYHIHILAYERLTEELIYSGKYELLYRLIDHLKGDWIIRSGFFHANVKMLVKYLIYSNEKDVFTNIAERCLLTKRQVIDFKDCWNEGLLYDEDKNEEEKVEVDRIMQGIISYLFDKFDNDVTQHRNKKLKVG